MSDQRYRHGKREAAGRTSALAEYWTRYKLWLAGLDRGQRIRYRVLQAVTILSVLIVVGFVGLRAWIRVPDLPGLNQGANGALTGDLSFDGAEAPNVALSGRKEGVYTFLLVGKDTAGGGNTDTMLLLTYDTQNKTINGLSLPRDTMVNVSTSSKRLNAVYNYNKGKDKALQVEKGMAALKKEVAHLTGITPDYYVIVEWEAIGELVDALGGVEFEVPFDMDYDDPTPGQDLHIHQKAGLRLLSGDDAMQVIRFRKNNDGSHSNGDVGRLKIQQDFLKAAAKKCLQPATFLKLPELVKIFSENVTTDLSIGNILAFAELAYGMDPEQDVNFATAPIGASFLYRGASLITLDETELLALLNERMNPYLQDIEAGDLQLVYQKGDGTFGVTNGTLADPQMGQVQASQSKPKPAEEETTTGETEQPEDGQTEGEVPGETGDSSQIGGEELSPDSSVEEGAPEGGQTSEEGGQTEDNSQSGAPIGTIDPDQVLPDPNADANVSQDIRRAGNEQDDTVAVLPSRPEPVGQAA